MQIRKLIQKATLLLTSILILLIILQFVVDKGLQKSRFANWGEWNDIFQSHADCDLLILGSSRAWVQFSTHILDSVLKLNSYNIGIDGYQFDMQYFRFKSYMQFNKKPSYVIVSLDIFSLAKPENLYEYEQFLPYLSNPSVAAQTKKYNGIKTSFYYLPFYKYAGTKNFWMVKMGVSEYFGLRDYNNGRYKGFKAQNSIWDGSFDEFKTKNSEGVNQTYDDETIKEFKEFLNYCESNNIQCFLVFSPEYFEVQKLFTNRDEILYLYKTLAEQFDATFLDFTTDSICFNKNLFYNSQHLNQAGATLFSDKLAKEIGIHIQSKSFNDISSR
jgi:hypothetical protein